MCENAAKLISLLQFLAPGDKLESSWELYIHILVLNRLCINSQRIVFYRKPWQIFLTQQSCHVEFEFENFDKLLIERDFLKSIHLFSNFCSVSFSFMYNVFHSFKTFLSLLKRVKAILTSYILMTERHFWSCLNLIENFVLEPAKFW